MNGLKKYGVPTVIVTLAAFVVCIGLWTLYVSGDNAQNVEVSIEESNMLNLGVLTPLIMFMASGLKVAALIGIPGFITILVRRVIDRNLHAEMNI